MQPRIRHRVPVLFLALAGASSAVAGCGSDPIPIEELGPELERRLCARAVSCGGLPDQATCEETAFIDGVGVQNVVASVGSGTIKYDGAKARDCLDAIPVTCEALLDQPAACDSIFTGTVAAGGACAQSLDCANRGRCAKPACGAACCLGTCQAVTTVAIGGFCGNENSVCAKDAFCANGTCAAPRAVGAACQGGLGECAAPAVCLSRPNGGGETCTVISTQPGGPCVPGANFGCVRDDERCDATTSRCVKRAAPGAACIGPEDCVGYAYCEAGTCKARPTAGQPCNAVGVSCIGSLVCLNGVCAAPPPIAACALPG